MWVVVEESDRALCVTVNSRFSWEGDKDTFYQRRSYATCNICKAVRTASV